MNLFEKPEDLREYLFRITDNGGETCDRFTIITSDGDYFGSNCSPFHPQGFFQSGERIDVQGVAERVESGAERDLRWIDLPEDVRRAVIGRLNEGFADWLTAFEPPVDRHLAQDIGSACRLSERAGEGAYGQPGAYRVKREGEGPEDDLGPFETLREAVLASLPDECDLAGPEYHGTVDLWEEGEPAPLWDKDEVE